MVEAQHWSNLGEIIISSVTAQSQVFQTHTLHLSYSKQIYRSLWLLQELTKMLYVWSPQRFVREVNLSQSWWWVGGREWWLLDYNLMSCLSNPDNLFIYFRHTPPPATMASLLPFFSLLFHSAHSLLLHTETCCKLCNI